METKVRTILVDDDALSVRNLLRLLGPFEEEIDVIGIATDGVKGLEMIDRLLPDLIFLDVELPLLDGFEVSRRMRQPAIVVFVTASSSYGREAKRSGSLACLCKPIGHDEMNELMNKVRVAVKLPARLRFQPGRH